MSDTTPLFVLFMGKINGQAHMGWVVLDFAPITSGKMIENLCHEIEVSREYDAGSVVVTNFRRLEMEKET